MKAFKGFKKILSLKTPEEKHKAWLKDYEGFYFSIGKNKGDKIFWSKEKEKYIYSDSRFDEPILCIDGKYRAQPNKIQRHPSRLIIEYDGDEKKAKEQLDKTQEKLKRSGWGYIRSSHGGKSDYLWTEFSREITDEEAKRFLKWIAEPQSEIDLNFANSNFRFPVLFAEHWKYPNQREEVVEFFEGDQIDYDSLGIKRIEGNEKITAGSYKTFIKENKSSSEYKILSLKELLEYESPSYSWRVDKLIQDKKIIIIGGSSATYKSWLCLSLGLSVSEGMDFLNNFPTEQGAVLFIDRENSIPELQSRVEMIKRGLNLNENKEIPFYFLSEQSIKLDNSNDRAFLEKYIIENKICLVIADTYRRLISFDENSADEVSFFFTDCLKPICERTGASFIFIHHHKKGKSSDEKELLRGSSDLVNFVDGVIQIVRKGTKIQINQTKNRSGKELEPFEVQIDTDEEEYLRFEYLGEKQDNSARGRAMVVLLLWFAENRISEFKTGEAQEVCKKKGIKKVNFHAGLRELEKRGEVFKKSHGLYSVPSKNEDLGKVQSSTPKRVELLNKLSPNKSNNSDSSIELSELSEQSEKQKKLGENEFLEALK